MFHDACSDLAATLRSGMWVKYDGYAFIAFMAVQYVYGGAPLKDASTFQVPTEVPFSKAPEPYVLSGCRGWSCSL